MLHIKHASCWACFISSNNNWVFSWEDEGIKHKGLDKLKDKSIVILSKDWHKICLTSSSLEEEQYSWEKIFYTWSVYIRGIFNSMWTSQCASFTSSKNELVYHTLIVRKTTYKCTTFANVHVEVTSQEVTHGNLSPHATFACQSIDFKLIFCYIFILYIELTVHSFLEVTAEPDLQWLSLDILTVGRLRSICNNLVDESCSKSNQGMY